MKGRERNLPALATAGRNTRNATDSSEDESAADEVSGLAGAKS